MVAPRRSGGLLAALAAVVLLPGLAGTASAHPSDPRTGVVVDAVSPALPAGVVLQARTGIAAQLVADNPTAVPLDVVGRDGRPFLRISSAGVYGDVGSPEFYETSSPGGAPARAPAPVRFVQISRGHAWGWYDLRLRPSGLVVPSDQRRPTRLAAFAVPFSYGGRPVRLTGHLEFRPLLGGFTTELVAAPAGVHAELLQGRLPAMLLSASPGTSLIVLGEDGQPFLRLAAAGSAVNTASRTYAEDRAARGVEGAVPGAVPRWQPVPGTSYTWLDGRLAAPQDPPKHAARAAIVAQWRIPLLVGGRPAALVGRVRWTPDPALATAAAAGGGPGPGLLALAACGAGVLAAGILLVRRLSPRRDARPRRRFAGGGGSAGTRRAPRRSAGTAR